MKNDEEKLIKNKTIKCNYNKLLIKNINENYVLFFFELPGLNEKILADINKNSTIITEFNKLSLKITTE